MGIPDKYQHARNLPLRVPDVYLGDGAELINGRLYSSFIIKGPSTVVIYNVSTTDATWTRIPTAGTDLTNVIYWRLSERDGQDFYYAFVAAPSTYATGFGMIERHSEITAIWVQRPSANNLNMQLSVWTA